MHRRTGHLNSTCCALFGPLPHQASLVTLVGYGAPRGSPTATGHLGPFSALIGARCRSACRLDTQSEGTAGMSSSVPRQALDAPMADHRLVATCKRLGSGVRVPNE